MRQAASVSETMMEYGRGIIGGLIFSLPLIFTMEIWWSGFVASPIALICCITATFLLLLGYNRYAGMRKDTSFFDLCWDSVEEIGLAFLVSFIFLYLIGEIGFEMSFDEIFGKIVIESMIVAIGISVGTAQLGADDDGDSGMEDEEDDEPNFYGIVVLSICGATLFASSIAPTDEVMEIALSINNFKLLLILLLSLALSAVILHFSKFKGSGKKKSSTKFIIQTTTIHYMIALVISFSLLYFFNRVVNHGFEVILAQTIVLSLPATMGASAGRLLISRST